VAWTLKKTLTVVGVGGVGAVVCFFTAGAAAPFIGGLIGSGLGLSGAAATSAGLAAVGGGAVITGGGGMAAGAALISGAAAVAGGTVAAAGAAVVSATSKEESRCGQCDALVEAADEHCPNCGKKRS